MARATKKQPPGPRGVAKGRIDSARALAEALGKSHTAVNRWLRDDRWPFGPGPWPAADLPKIRAWCDRELAESNHPPAAGGLPKTAREQLKDLSPARQADVALKLTRREKLQFELARDKGLYHRVDECLRDQLRRVHEVKTLFLGMADGLPLDADSKMIVKGRVLEILRQLSAPAEQAAAAAESHAAAPGTAAAGR